MSCRGRMLESVRVGVEVRDGRVTVDDHEKMRLAIRTPDHQTLSRNESLLSIRALGENSHVRIDLDADDVDELAAVLESIDRDGSDVEEGR